MEIAEWLASIGLAAFTQAFRDNHIEIDDVSSLTMDDLKELGVTSVGHRRRILSAIASRQEVQPHLVRQAGPRADWISGERRQVTVLFADIAGFTTLSNELDAEHVHVLLSVFFEQVDRIISDFGGRIDKHIGDCAMAVFGARLHTVTTCIGQSRRRWRSTAQWITFRGRWIRRLPLTSESRAVKLLRAVPEARDTRNSPSPVKP